MRRADRHARLGGAVAVGGLEALKPISPPGPDGWDVDHGRRAGCARSRVPPHRPYRRPGPGLICFDGRFMLKRHAPRDSSGRPLLNPTSLSLLDRLKAARPDASDWDRLQGIYLPLIRRWLGRVPGLGDEAADLAQEVLVVVVREVPRFDRRREGSFRAWLRQVTVNKVRTYRRQRHRRPAVGLDPADGFLERLADPNGDLAREWDRDHDQPRRREAAGGRPARLQPDHLGGVPAVRARRRPGRPGGRGTGDVRERRDPGQVPGPQAVKGGSRRASWVNSRFSRQVRRRTGLSLSETPIDATRPGPGDRPMDAAPSLHPTDQTLQLVRPGQARRRLGRGGQRAPGGLPRLPAAGRRDVGRQLPRPGPRRPEASGRSTSGRSQPGGTLSARGGRTPRRRPRPTRSRRAWPTTPITRSSGSSAGAGWAWSTWPTTR